MSCVEVPRTVNGGGDGLHVLAMVFIGGDGGVSGTRCGFCWIDSGSSGMDLTLVLLDLVVASVILLDMVVFFVDTSNGGGVAQRQIWDFLFFWVVNVEW